MAEVISMGLSVDAKNGGTELLEGRKDIKAPTSGAQKKKKKSNDEVDL